MKNMFKIASLLSAAVMLLACEPEAKVGEFYITSDKDVIQSNGVDAATIRVMVGDTDVTAEAVIYDENNNVLNLSDGIFTADKDGEYKFWATYGTYSSYNKNLDDKGLFTIRAISVVVPEPVADKQPNNKSFVHRAFLTQYTGTGCGYCPYMIKILKELMAENTIPEKAVLAAVHSYSNADPAYIAAPRVNSYPYLTIDLVQGFSHSQSSTVLNSLVEASVTPSAKAGIAANPIVYEKEGLLVVRVSVKAAVDGIFNVGAWLLEDNIYGQQADYDGIGDKSFNYHENCVRVTDSKYKGTYFGHALGNMTEGDTAYKTFVIDLKRDWKKENLHLALFVSYGEKSGDKISYTVCNAVDVPIDAPTPFDYK